MAYGQRVAYHITPIGYSIVIQNAQCEWGRFYAWPDQDNDAEPDGQQIANGTPTPGVVAATGRESASSGTQGSFEIADLETGTVVGTFTWNCPYTGSNSWSYEPSTDPAASQYVTQATGGSLTGPIGDIWVKSYKAG
jgi:hypothetical protein